MRPNFILRSILSGCLVLASAGMQGQAPPTTFAPQDEVRLGQATSSKHEGSLIIGSGNLRFKGTWAPLLQGGRRIGLYLEGEGSLTYASTFSPEAPVFLSNLKAWTPARPVKGKDSIMVTIPFNRARVLLAGPHAPVWEGVEAPSLESSYRPFLQRWKGVEDHLPLQLLALQALNAPEKPLAILELEDGPRRWVFKHDQAERTEESLHWVCDYPNPRPELKGMAFLRLLSRQYLGWDPRKGQLRPAHFLLTDLDVDLRTKDTRNAEVVVQETLLPLEEGLQVFPFQLRNAVLTASDERRLKVRCVLDSEGQPLAYDHVGGQLMVRLPQAASKGKPFTLRFEYAGDFLIQPNQDNYWELPMRGAWYPTPENLASEWYTFHGTVRTTGDWIAFLPGETVRREKEGDWNLVETRTTRPICFATILAGKYFLDEETHDGLTVRVATYAFKPGTANQIFKAQAFNVIRYYERFLGPFPFKEFLIVQKNDWGYGQAPPGMMYITRDAFEQAQTALKLQAQANQMEALRRQGYRGPIVTGLKTMDVRHVFAHEIAHQYWGTVVKMPNRLEQWITESFADLCAGLFERDYKGSSLWSRNLSIWEGGAEEAAKLAPIPLANDLHFTDAHETFQAWKNLLYRKGPMLLAAIQQEVGEGPFLTWLKSLQSNFRWRFMTTRQAFDVLTVITKKDFTEFYEDCYWNLSLPRLKH